MPTILTHSDDLTKLQSSAAGFTLLDVRLPEDFALAHLPGSVNQCVFEMVFLDELHKKSVRKDLPVCVYGMAEDSHEARMASEKLERAGFARVFEFRPGLASWRSHGNAVEETTPPPAGMPFPDGRHEIDLPESTVVWVGRNLINKHWGRVALTSGYVEFVNGKPAAGSAILDMKRITSSDLADSNLHDVLIHHLESDDFFDVANHSEAQYTFHQAEVCSDKPGCNNLKLHGALTLRGVTRPLVIDAAAGFTPDGRAALQSTFTIDRTDWGVIYGSGKFFRSLAGHLVNDRIELQLRMLTSAPLPK